MVQSKQERIQELYFNRYSVTDIAKITGYGKNEIIHGIIIAEFSKHYDIKMKK